MRMYIYYVLILLIGKENSSQILLLNPHLPVELSLLGGYERLVFIAFNHSFLELIQLPYFHHIRRLFDETTSGCLLSARFSCRVEEELVGLSNSYSLQDFIRIVQVLESVALAEGKKSLYGHYPDRLSCREMTREHSLHLEKIVRFINLRYSEDISLQLIGDEIGLSREYLSSFCSLYLPGGFSGYLKDVRMSKVAEMLTQTDYSVLAVASSCGFNTLSNFMVLFKKYFGMTPGEYRIQKSRAGRARD